MKAVVFSHHNLLIYEIFLNYPGAGEIKARLLVLSVLSSLMTRSSRIRCLLLASTSTCTHEYIPHSHIIKNEKKINQREVKTCTSTNYWAQGTAIRAGLQEMRFQTDNAEDAKSAGREPLVLPACICLQSVGQTEDVNRVESMETRN